MRVGAIVEQVCGGSDSRQIMVTHIERNQPPRTKAGLQLPHQMKPAHQCFALRICLITLLAHVVGYLQLYGQTSEHIDAMNASLDQILRSVPFGNDATVQQVVLNLTSKYGRETASKMICSVVRDRAVNVDELYAARLVGNSFQPEFSRAVFQALHDTGYSLAVARLLTLLRDAPPEDAKGIALWLSDARPAEDLTRRGREVRGAPFRVCDIAYNVLQEIQATDKSQIQLITHSLSIAQREALIAPIREQSSDPSKPNSANEAAPKGGFTTPKTVRNGVELNGTSNPVPKEIASLPLSRFNGWLWWASILIIFAAAAGWLLLRSKRKKG